LILKDGEVYRRWSPSRGQCRPTPFRNITVQIQGRDDNAPDPLADDDTSATGATVALGERLVRMDRVMLGPVERRTPPAIVTC
jgi:hypothetical protein